MICRGDGGVRGFTPRLHDWSQDCDTVTVQRPHNLMARGVFMKIAISEFGELGTKVTLVGRLDIAGADAIDLPLATVAGRRGNVVIDMAGVEFLASIGIRHLVTAAKAIARGAGRLVLLDPSPIVTEVLVTAGLEEVLPIVRSEDEARAKLAG
jgi:anti-anti-sigma factor